MYQVNWNELWSSSTSLMRDESKLFITGNKDVSRSFIHSLLHFIAIVIKAIRKQLDHKANNICPVRSFNHNQSGSFNQQPKNISKHSNFVSITVLRAIKFMKVNY